MIDVDPVGERLVQTAAVTITSAQILNCYTSPVQVIAAPGAGNMIQILSSAYSFTGSTYTASASAGLWYGSPANDDQADQTALNLGSGGFAFGTGQTNGGDVYANIVNQPINFSVAHSAGGNPTSGTGVVKLVVTYLVLAVPQ